MKLINKKTGFVVLEFREELAIFHDPFLEKEMRQRGIVIPAYLQANFSGKKRIRLEDLDFQRAFREVYCLHFLEQTAYTETT